MLLRKLISITLVVAFMWVFLSGSALAKTKEGITLYTIKKDYKKAKYEPDNGIYLCAYVLQDATIDYSMKKFNKLTEKKHASFFKYVGYGQPFPKKWVEDVKSVGAIPHIAWEPNKGLEQVKDDKYLKDFAKEANNSGVPIFLRYASEMNGTWTQYSGKSKQYIEKWKLVHDVMKKEAPNVIMVWTVFTFPDYTIQDFYPGDAYVDWVGVNVYNVIYHNNNINTDASYEDPLKLLDYVYNTYSYKKPIQISEFGVSHYTTTDNKYHVDFAKSKLARFYGEVPSKYPRVKSIFYFDVNNLLNAPAGRKINDYSITNNQEILKTYASLVKGKEYLSTVLKENTKISDEKLSYRGFSFDNNGTIYSSIEFFKNYLDLSVKIDGKKAIVSDGNKTYKYNIVNKKVPKGYEYKYACWTISGLPLRKVADNFGYKVNYNLKDNSIFISK